MTACIQTAIRGGLLFVLMLLCPLTAVADPALTQRLRAEAVEAWRGRMKDLSIQGVCRSTTRDEKGERNSVVEVMRNVDCAWSKSTQSTGITDVYCYNPKYTFHIRSQPNQGWAIVSFHGGDLASSHEAREVRSRLERLVWVFEAEVRDPFFLEPLLQYLEGPSTRAVSAKTHATDVAQVEMKLDMGPPTKDSIVPRLTSILDPAHGWRAVRTEMIRETSDVKAEITGEYEYTPGQDGLLRRAQLRQHWKYTNGKTRSVESDRRFDLKRLTTLPDTGEFTLSAFGLPEPVGVEWPKRRSGWLRLAWAGAGFVVVALAFVALRRRAARRQAAAPPTSS